MARIGANRGIHAVMLDQTGEGAPRDVAAANDEQSLHLRILAEFPFLSPDTMSYRITIEPSRHQFEVEPGNTLLRAALEAAGRELEARPALVPPHDPGSAERDGAFYKPIRDAGLATGKLLPP